MDKTRHYDILREDRYCCVDDGRMHQDGTALGCGWEDNVHQDAGRTPADFIGYYRWSTDEWK